VIAISASTRAAAEVRTRENSRPETTRCRSVRAAVRTATEFGND
jgi:hypothetical protein